MFRSSIMKSDRWKCGICAPSQLWGVHMFDDDSNILGTSCSTWWTKDLRQIAAKFVPIHWKMTRNKTNFLCARAYKNRPKRKETSIQFRAGDESWVYCYDPGTKQQSSQWKNHPSAIQESWGTWSQALFSVFLNREAILKKEFFLQRQPVNQQFCIGVLRVFMEAVGRKCPTSGIHRTGFCIMTTCHGKRIYGFFWCLTNERWWWYLASLLFHPSLHGIFWYSEIETWLRGEDSRISWRQSWIAGSTGAHCKTSVSEMFPAVGETLGNVFKPRRGSRWMRILNCN